MRSSSPSPSLSSSSSSSTPCAACRFLRRKCIPECSFAPYFPPDQPTKFINVHKVYGASNVAKLLNELHPSCRLDAVSSLNFEAESRLHDPIYGCTRQIYFLLQNLKLLHHHLRAAKEELSSYCAPPTANLSHSDYLDSFVSSIEAPPAESISSCPPHNPKALQMPAEAHQLAGVPTSNRELLIRRNHSQPHKTELGLFAAGFDGPTTSHGFNAPVAFENLSLQERDPHYPQVPMIDDDGRGDRYGPST